MAQTSINIKPVKPGSYQHNTREKDLPYIRPELSHRNESWQDPYAPTIEQHLREIKCDYLEHHGKALPKNSTPIREGVVVIQEDTTLDELRRACRACEEQWGIKAMQIHIHRDEGHHRAKTWKPNLHAHIVFSWYDMEKHCTRKLTRQDTSEMQDIFAEALQMERGASSDRKHLDAVQFKNQAEEARKTEIKAEIEALKREYSREVVDHTLALREVAKSLVFHSDRFSKVIPPDEETTEHRDKLDELQKQDLQQVFRQNRVLRYMDDLNKHITALSGRIVKMFQKFCTLFPDLKLENENLKKKLASTRLELSQMKEAEAKRNKKKGIGW